MKRLFKSLTAKISANQKRHARTTLRDLKPLNLGKVLRPLLQRDDLLDEMLK